MTESEKAVEWPTSLIGLLNQDLDWQAADSSRPDYAKGRRALVRAVFATVEGTVFQLKQYLLELGRLRVLPLSIAETALLREEAYDLTDNGSVRLVAARLPFLPNFRFTLAMLHKAGHSSKEIDYGGSGWQGLRDSLKVRHRLMHPKQPVDLAVTDEEFTSLKAGVLWYKAAVTGQLDDVRAHLGTLRRAPASRPN